ncbi:TIGR02611 family protein [Actinoplanes oblitus]|uniref:TIGR02611 family protein n=1 Tax=Actinoplanes oblitus TaxID=3040509 RepID=A0ABY8WDL5_9ACTN|nr:TIGR02611 family protein [Actinoplanes oblitus]WIM95022.1 TIGR02611 family protein [Actinoplanes oblitus]
MGVKPDDKASDVRLLDRIRSTPSGRLALKIGIGVLGTLVVALGIVLIPFPGPGWAIVILGLAILALEFAWAKNLLEFTKRHVKNWTHWIARQSLPVRAVIGVVGMIFVAAVVWAAVRLSLGVDLIQWTRDWFATH